MTGRGIGALQALYQQFQCRILANCCSSESPFSLSGFYFAISKCIRILSEMENFQFPVMILQIGLEVVGREQRLFSKSLLNHDSSKFGLVSIFPAKLRPHSVIKFWPNYSSILNSLAKISYGVILENNYTLRVDFSKLIISE